MGFIIDNIKLKSEQTVLAFSQIELMHGPVNIENIASAVTARQIVS